MEPAAIVGTVGIGLVMLFQLALVIGAPWGSAAWGGRHAGALPAGLRLASAAALLLLGLLAWIVLARSGLVARSPLPASWLDPAAWAVAAYFALGVVMNAVSRSRVERVWAPVSLAIAIASAIVAAG